MEVAPSVETSQALERAANGRPFYIDHAAMMFGYEIQTVAKPNDSPQKN